MAAAIREKHSKVVDAGRNKDKTVEQGREFVEAYVEFMHHVEGIHAAVASGGGHHSSGSKEAPEHAGHQN